MYRVVWYFSLYSFEQAVVPQDYTAYESCLDRSFAAYIAVSFYGFMSPQAHS